MLRVGVESFGSSWKNSAHPLAIKIRVDIPMVHSRPRTIQETIEIVRDVFDYPFVVSA